MTPLEEKINTVATKQAEHGEKLKQIYTAITGDKELGHKGVIPMLHDHEERITKLQETDKKRWWFIVGFSSGSGFLGGLFGGPTVKFIIAKISSAIFFLKP